MQSIAVAHILQNRIDACTARGCRVAECNPAVFRQLVTQAQHLPKLGRRDAVMEDLHYYLHARDSRPGNPYAVHIPQLRLSIGDVAVCDLCYASCHGITIDVLKGLKRRVNQAEYNFVDKRQNNKSNQFHSATSFAKAEEAVDKFFQQFKITDACEIPDSTRTVHAKKPTHVLPVTLTKNDVYNRFCAETDTKICFNRFSARWKSHHSEIIQGTKKTAYCDFCFQKKCRQKSLSDAETIAWKKHLNAAQSWREQYRVDMQRAKDGVIDMFCIDKAESLRAPRKASEQPSADCFKSGLRITINGVFDVAENKSYVHVMNESQTIGENGSGDADSDFVLSCLWDVISRKPLRSEVVIQADNCTAQNKNNYVLKFAAFLVEMKYCKKVSVNFMIVGHTKFIVDGCFGAVKRQMIRCDLYSEEDIIRQFPDSDDIKESMHICAKAAPTWFAWRSFMHKKFGPQQLPGLLSYQKFVVEKEQENNETEVLLAARVLPGDDAVPFKTFVSKCDDIMPNEVESAGIDAKRKAELQKFFLMYSGTPFSGVFHDLKFC